MRIWAAEFSDFCLPIHMFKNSFSRNETVLKMLRTPKLIHEIDADEKNRVLYQAGCVSNYFIIIMEGHVSVKVGDDGLEFDKGPWIWGLEISKFLKKTYVLFASFLQNL